MRFGFRLVQLVLEIFGGFIVEPLRIVSRDGEMSKIRSKRSERSSKLTQCFGRIARTEVRDQKSDISERAAICALATINASKVDLQPQSGAIFIDHARPEITRRSVGARCSVAHKWATRY